MKAKVIITFVVTENLKDYDLIDGKKVTIKQVKQLLKEDLEDLEILSNTLYYKAKKYKVTVK